MKITIRRFNPQTEKEKMFRIEAEVNELKNPGEAFMMLDGKEYTIEVHYESPRISMLSKT